MDHQVGSDTLFCTTFSQNLIISLHNTHFRRRGPSGGQRHTLLYILVHSYFEVHSYIHTHTYTYMPLHTYTHTHTCIHTHTCTHTYTYMHIHTPFHSFSHNLVICFTTHSRLFINFHTPFHNPFHNILFHNTPSPHTFFTTLFPITPFPNPFTFPFSSIDQGTIIVDGHEGDYHDVSMTSYGTSVFLDLTLGGTVTASAFTITAYPSQAFYDQYITNTPFVACFVMVAALVFALIVIGLYDYMVRCDGVRKRV